MGGWRVESDKARMERMERGVGRIELGGRRWLDGWMTVDAVSGPDGLPWSPAGWVGRWVGGWVGGWVLARRARGRSGGLQVLGMLGAGCVRV